MKGSGSPDFAIFSTCPQSKDVDRREYLQQVADIAGWSEDAGYRGILVYTDNGLVDPWLVAQVIIQSTAELCPLVAVQPVYMHPYTAAKMICSLAFLYRRRIYLNMLAGGFKNDLIALGDETPHDERYLKMTEYTLIVKQLLSARASVTFNGTYYKVAGLKMTPTLPEDMLPGILVSGSSPAGLEAARILGATAVKYPKPPSEEEDQTTNEIDSGIRVGVITRESAEEAWRVAHERFPEDRKGQLAHGLAMKVSDSQWHRQLSELDEKSGSNESPYWLGPFQNYKTFCPYLVGSYERVGAELSRYIGLGFKVFILDIPSSREELEHTAIAFDAAAAHIC
jgi:alkanesulfonate monooxygenase